MPVNQNLQSKSPRIYSGNVTAVSPEDCHLDVLCYCSLSSPPEHACLQNHSYINDFMLNIC